MGAALRNDYSWLNQVAMQVNLGKELITVGENDAVRKFREDAAFAGPGFFDVFTA